MVDNSQLIFRADPADLFNLKTHNERRVGGQEVSGPGLGHQTSRIHPRTLAMTILTK